LAQTFLISGPLSSASFRGAFSVIEPLQRRFPPPWSIDELEACFVVIDSAGQKLAYVYFEDEPDRPSHVPGRSIKL